MEAITQALRMIDVFESVGADRFDFTQTDLDGKKTHYRAGQGSHALRQAMPRLLEEAARHQHNLILRPHAQGVQLVQLDDLNATALARVASASFLTLETSPGNYQAWLAIPGGTPELARTLRKESGADQSASGATRLAGSRNFKRKYAPHFPTVAIVEARPGHTLAKDTLAQRSGPAEATSPAAKPAKTRRGRAWPSYERCLQYAPPNQAGTAPDVSRADFTWCLIAIDWGWSIEDTAAKLLEKSEKAKENGERYALLTAQNAAAAAARRQSQAR